MSTPPTHSPTAFETLRAHLHAEPSELCWIKVCETLDELAPGEDRRVAFDYAAQLVAAEPGWAQVVRCAPGSWLGALRSGLPHPATALLSVAALDLHELESLLPAGRFVMGSPSSEPGHDLDEERHHVVLTRSLLVASTTVTQAQWTAIFGNNPSEFVAAERPVERVSWFDAVAFCNALSERHGLEPAYRIHHARHTPGTGRFSAQVKLLGLHRSGYRLPTEAEWEYAARAGTSTGTWRGDLSDPGGFDPMLDAIAWFNENSGDMTQPVAHKPSNPWGFYDMLGNVWEWCHDVFVDYDRAWLDARPPLSIDPVGPLHSPQGHRVARGGCGGGPASLCRAAQRGFNPDGRRSSNLGFRVVRTCPRTAGQERGELRAAPSADRS